MRAPVPCCDGSARVRPLHSCVPTPIACTTACALLMSRQSLSLPERCRHAMIVDDTCRKQLHSAALIGRGGTSFGAGAWSSLASSQPHAVVVRTYVKLCAAQADADGSKASQRWHDNCADAPKVSLPLRLGASKAQKPYTRTFSDDAAAMRY